MALTAAEQAEYDSLVARLGPSQPIASSAPTPLEGGIFSRIGQQAANYIPNVAEGLLHSGQNIVNAIVPEGGVMPMVNVPKPYDIAPAQTTGEKIVDVGAEFAQVLPQFVVPELAATRLATMAGAGPKAARVLGGGLGWGFGAAEQDMEAAGVNAAMGAMQGAADFLPRRERTALAVATGLLTGAEASRAGSSDMEAGVWGAVGAGLVFATPQIKQALARQGERQLVDGMKDGATPAPTGSPGTVTPADIKRPSAPDPSPIIGKAGEMPSWLTMRGPEQPRIIPADHVEPTTVIRPPLTEYTPSPGVLRTDLPTQFDNNFLPPDMQARILEGNQPRPRTTSSGQLDPLLAPIQMDIPLARRIAPEPTAAPADLILPQGRGPGAEFFPELVPERIRGGIQSPAFDVQSLVPEQYRSGVLTHGPAPRLTVGDRFTLPAGEEGVILSNKHGQIQAEIVFAPKGSKYEAGQAISPSPFDVSPIVSKADDTRIQNLDAPGYLRAKPTKVATLQKSTPHPQSKFPSGLQKLLKDAPGWAPEGESLKAGFTEDAFAFGLMAKNDKDVKRMYEAAQRMEDHALKLMEDGTIEGVMAAQEFTSKVQYLREAAQYAEGFPAKLDQFLERDPNYIPPVPSKEYLERFKANQKPKIQPGEEHLIQTVDGPSEAMVTEVTPDGKVTYEVFDAEAGDIVQKVATLQEFENLSKNVDEFSGFKKPVEPAVPLPPKPAPQVEAPRPTVVESDFDQLKRLAAEKRAREEAGMGKYSTHLGGSTPGTVSASSRRVKQQFDELDTFYRQAKREADPSKIKAAEKDLDNLMPKVIKQVITDMFSADAARKAASKTSYGFAGGDPLNFYSARDIFDFMQDAAGYEFPKLNKLVERKSAVGGGTWSGQPSKAEQVARFKRELDKLANEKKLDRLTGLNREGKETTTYHLLEHEEYDIVDWANETGALFYKDFNKFIEKHSPEIATLQKSEPPTPAASPTTPTDRVRVNHNGRWVEAKMVGVEDGTYHVKVDDPVRGELDVFTKDIKQVKAPEPKITGGEVPFKDVPGAKTQISRADEPYFAREMDKASGEWPDNVVEVMNRKDAPVGVPFYEAGSPNKIFQIENLNGKKYEVVVKRDDPKYVWEIHFGADNSLARTGDGYAVGKTILPVIQNLTEMVKAKYPNAIFRNAANERQKLPIFRRFLERNGFKFVDNNHFIPEDAVFNRSDYDKIAIDFSGPVAFIPAEQTVEQALRMLSPSSSVLMRTVLARLQNAVGQNLKLTVRDLKGASARAFRSGDIAISHNYLKGVVKNWDNMTEATRANAMLRVSTTVAHEIAHVATRYGEMTGLTYNGQKITDAVTSLVHRTPLRNRELIIKQIQSQSGPLPDQLVKYLAGDLDAVHGHYSKRAPNITKEQSARIAAEEFMVELATVELHKRMDTTGLPQAFREIVNKFKQVLVNTLEWLSGNGQKVATLQDLSKLTEHVLDHYKGGRREQLAFAFNQRASIPHPSLQGLDFPAPSTSVPPPAAPFVRNELIRLGIRTAAGAAIGAGGSKFSDGEITMFEGMLAGGVLGAFGPAAIKRIANSGGVDAIKQAKGNPIKLWQNILNGETVGDRLRSLGAEGRFGDGSGLAKMVRFLEAELGVNLDPALKSAVEHSRGLAAEVAQIVQDALDKARWHTPTEAVNLAALQYFEGKISKADFLKALSTDEEKTFGALITTAREATTRLSEMFASGMADSKFKAMVIKNKETYLGRFYKAFHSGEFDMSKFDAAKKDLMERFPEYSGEVADSILHEYMREVKANRTIFRRRGNAGQKIDTTLHRRRLITEQEIEDQMLKIADLEATAPGSTELKDAQKMLKWMQGHQITDNWRAWMGEYTGAKERALLTFAKLHPTSVSAKVYDILANSKDQFGLKFAYNATELSKTTEAIKARLTAKPPADEVATLQRQLKELEAYVPIPSGAAYGKLSGQFTSRFVRDEIATYSTPFQFMEQPILRGIASFNNVVKVSRTALNPITVIRNYLQMPVFGLIAKTGVRDVREAFKEIHHTKGDLYKLMLREGVTTSDFVASELTKGPGWMFSGYADSDIATRVARYGFEKALDFYRQPDMLIRAGAFISAQKRFASEIFKTTSPTKAQLFDPQVVAKARDFTNRYTMNYDTVPRIVKLGRQLPFVSLFISYTSEITRIMKNLTEDAIKPGADSAGRMHAIGVLSGMAAIPALLTTAFESSLSERDRKDWDKVKRLSPDYSRSRFQIPYKRDEQGRFHYFDITNLIPIDSYAQMVKAFSAGDFEAAAAANPIASLQNTPLLNIAVEQITGEDLHTAKPVRGFDRVTEVLKEVLPPVIPPGYEGERLQRAFARNAEGGFGTENMKTGVQVKPSDIVANYLTGMRFANVTLSNIQSRFVAQTKREIAEHQAILRDVMRTNARPEVKAQAQENYRRSVQEILVRMNEKLGVDGATQAP